MDIDQAKEERRYLNKLIASTYSKTGKTCARFATYAYAACGLALIAAPFTYGWRCVALAGGLFIIAIVASLTSHLAQQEKFHADLTDLAMAARLRENEVTLLDPTDLRLIMSAVDYESMNFDQRRAYEVAVAQATKAELHRDAHHAKPRNTFRRPSRGPLS